MGCEEDLNENEPLIKLDRDTNRLEPRIIDLFLKAIDNEAEGEVGLPEIEIPDDSIKLADNAAWEHLKDLSECYVFINRLKMESDAYWSALPQGDEKSAHKLSSDSDILRQETDDTSL